MITLLCAAGFVSGILVLYRGYSADMRELVVIGAFLIIIFPVIYQQAIRVAKIAYGGGPSATAKGHAKRAGV
jgi:fucose permease